MPHRTAASLLRHSVAWLLPIAFALVLFSRSPGHLTRAEFWAEDGRLWYQGAYDAGITCLLWPANGYLQTISRLVALAAQLVPLAWAPAMFAVVAFVGQLVPALFLLSRRMDRAWPNRPARCGFALLYLGLPNAWETYVNLTNTQWYLAILAFLVLVGDMPRSKAGRLFDAAVLLLSALSGPFCLLLAPIAVWRLVELRNAPAFERCAVLALGACGQAASLLLTLNAVRTNAPLGAHLPTFARILTQKVMLGALGGQSVARWLWQTALWRDGTLPEVGALAGVLLAGIACLRGSTLLRQTCAFGALMLGAALARPMVSLDQPQWRVLEQPAAGTRYFLVPMLVWIAILFACAGDRDLRLRTAGVVLLLAVIASVPGSWTYPKLPPSGFQRQARAFQNAPVGASVTLSEQPPGWTMTLVKR